MADALTPMAASAAASAAAAAAQGMDGDAVLTMALLGAAVSMWAQHGRAFEASRAWLFGALATFGAAAVVGYVAPEVVMAFAPEYAVTKPAAKITSGVIALGAAAASHLAWGLLRDRVRALLGSKDGGGNGQ